MRGVVSVARHNVWGRECGPSCCEWGVWGDARPMVGKCRGYPICMRGMIGCAGHVESPVYSQGVGGVAGREEYVGTFLEVVGAHAA